MASNEGAPEGVSVPVESSRGFDRRWLFVVLLITMVAIDQAVKAWARGAMNIGGSISGPFPSIFEFQLTHNEGIAFGLAQGKGGWFTPIALIISIGAGYYSWRHPREPKAIHVAMGLLAAGALGNLYDRVIYGFVTDMFALRFFRFPVFNWADSCITIATVILILAWSKEAIQHRPQADAAA